MADEYIYEIIKNEADARYCAYLIAEEFCAWEPVEIFNQTSPTYFFDFRVMAINERDVS